MEPIADLPTTTTRLPTPPPAYSPPTRCYQLRADGSNAPCVYVPRGHPDDDDDDRRVAATADQKLAFYKPSGFAPPPYREAEDEEEEEDGGRHWAARQQKSAERLEARIRALEAQLRAQAVK